MALAKEKIITLLELMNEDEARNVLDYIKKSYRLTPKEASWDNVAEEEPDEWDLQMLKEIEDDPECKEFSNL